MTLKYHCGNHVVTAEYTKQSDAGSPIHVKCPNNAIAMQVQVRFVCTFGGEIMANYICETIPKYVHYAFVICLPEMGYVICIDT